MNWEFDRPRIACSALATAAFLSFFGADLAAAQPANSNAAAMVASDAAGTSRQRNGNDRPGSENSSAPVATSQPDDNVSSTQRPDINALPESTGSNFFLGQWNVGNENVVARPQLGVKYFLLNQNASGAQIFYSSGTRDNISLSKGHDRIEWEFRKSPGSNYLAIYNHTAGKYLSAASGTVGAVTWSSTPAYQWSWASAGNFNIALFNSRKQDYLMTRNYKYEDGKWLSMLDWRYHPLPDPEPQVTSTIHTFSVTMVAQPPVQGYVPFYALFPAFGVNTGDLIEVTNLTTPLWFVLPQHSSSECGQNGATIYLAPNAKMTSEQMTKLWGSSKPSLKNGGVPFLACAQSSLASVRVNIKWQGQ